ncbi:MAG: LLM class flavin-dependent oxidoreductase [Deltaproteobacteria bacterium]|nr:LLM class flavin-dependent oxidoreductase [Deltaproteobacteria bacterium]MBI2364810.1 LLM class flavin-dependent oxidoreductase [Deltaproteobacteria bacterium]
MRVGLCFDGFYSIQEMIELARLADDTGMESIWMSDHLCFRDSLTTSMALLASTKRIQVAPAPMSPYSRHPIISAMSIATMEEFAPGRVIASPGTGNAAALKEAGMESPRPLKTMREYVEILRRFLRGETVNFQGEMFKINGAKMGFVPSTPIKMYLTAVRPRMLQLGGEIGDGVLLSGGCSPGYIARCVSEIQTGAERAGRSLAARDVAGFVTAAVSDDPKEAIEANKMFLAYVFRNVHHAENIRLGGGRVDQEGLAAAVGKRDWEAAKKFINDEVVLAHSVAGTPAECRRQLEAFVKGGLNLPVLLPTGTQEARKRVIRMAREVLS